MFAIKRVGDWVGSCVKWVTASFADPPRDSDRLIPEYRAVIVHVTIECFERSVESYYPHRQDVLQLLGEVKKELLAENGGTDAGKLLSDWTWKEDQYSWQQNQTMLRIAKRWSNPDSIKAEFWGLDLYNEDGSNKNPYRRTLTEERLQEVERWSREWLTNRRNGSKMD